MLHVFKSSESYFSLRIFGGLMKIRPVFVVIVCTDDFDVEEINARRGSNICQVEAAIW